MRRNHKNHKGSACGLSLLYVGIQREFKAMARSSFHYLKELCAHMDISVEILRKIPMLS